MNKKIKIEYPLGNILYCEVLQTHYSLSLPGLPVCKELAVSAAEVSRTILWDAWTDFRNGREKDKKVERLIVQKTEYWTDLNDDREFVTAFIDKFVRSIPGNTSIPVQF